MVVLADGRFNRWLTVSAIFQHGFAFMNYVTDGQSFTAFNGWYRRLALSRPSLPHRLEDMAGSGNPVRLEFDEQTGLYDLTAILPGDLIFLKGNQEDQNQPADLAICVADHQVLHAGTGQTSIRLIDIRQDQKLQNNILFVRRLFN